MSKILIVEDEESIAELEKDYLELSGFEVEIEMTEKPGLKRGDFGGVRPLVSWILCCREWTGFEICKKIRETKKHTGDHDLRKERRYR